MKKIFTFVALGLIGVLAITVITLAVVKKNYNQLPTDKVQFIEVNYNGKKDTFEKTSDKVKVYKELLNKYSESTHESVLSALFQGAFASSANAQLIEESENVDNKRSGSSVVSITFIYSEDQVIKFNGKAYLNETKNEEVKYNYVTIVIENKDTLATTTAYFHDDKSSNNVSDYQLRFLSTQSILFNYVAQLEEDGLLA